MRSQINKTADRMYALLAICQALCPTKVDEGIATVMKEKFGDQHSKMIRGGDDSLAAFEEMYLHGAPRFISPNPPPYELESDEALQAYAAVPDASQHQLTLFVSTVEPQLSTSTLRSFLRLYTTLGTEKLANFLGVTEEQVLEMLMVAKGAARKLTWVDPTVTSTSTAAASSSSPSLLEGEIVGVSDLNFGIDESHHLLVAQTTTSRQFGGFFLRHALKWADVADHLKSKPLPIPTTATGSGAGAAAGVPTSLSSGGNGKGTGANSVSSGGKPVWGKA